MLSTAMEGSSREGEICCFFLSLSEVTTLCSQSMEHGDNTPGLHSKSFSVL